MCESVAFGFSATCTIDVKNEFVGKDLELMFFAPSGADSRASQRGDGAEAQPCKGYQRQSAATGGK